MDYKIYRPESLEDIDLSDIQDYPPVDGGIKNLVRALRGLNLVTMGSCQGHLDHGYPYPWVSIYLWDCDYEELDQIIKHYNKTDAVRWEIDGNVLKPIIKASNEKGLRELQENADKLARFLFDNYILV